jgi:protease I
MKLQGKRVAILVEDNYEALEVWYPDLCLREAGVEVTIVGPEARSYKSTHGLPVQARVSADQIRVADFDALVIPSGAAAEAISYQPPMLALIDAAIHQGKLLAVIVSAGRPLAAAADECKKDVVVLFDMQPTLRKAEGSYANNAVIRKGNLIQARSPADLVAFCRKIIAALVTAQPSAGANMNRS